MRRRRVVSYPHGWGHHGGCHTANSRGGANINALLTTDLTVKDVLSGSSHLDGVTVTMKRVIPPNQDTSAIAMPGPRQDTPFVNSTQRSGSTRPLNP